MQTKAVIVYSNMLIETIFPCIPSLKKVREEVGAYSKGGGSGRGGRFFDIMKWGVGTYSGKGTYKSVGAHSRIYGIHYL